MAARIAKSFASPTNQVFRLCGRNSGGLPDGKTTAKKAAASQRTGVTSNSRLGRSLSSPSASFKSLLGTRRRSTSVFFRYSSCSLLPLHSAIASAKLVPQLNSTADTLLQGTTTTTKPFFFFFFFFFLGVSEKLEMQQCFSQDFWYLWLILQTTNVEQARILGQTCTDPQTKNPSVRETNCASLLLHFTSSRKTKQKMQQGLLQGLLMLWCYFMMFFCQEECGLLTTIKMSQCCNCSHHAAIIRKASRKKKPNIAR